MSSPTNAAHPTPPSFPSALSSHARRHPPPSAMSALPTPALLPTKRNRTSLLSVPTLLSLLLIFLLLRPSSRTLPTPTLTQPSLFRAHEPPALYERRRDYASYPWGVVCSSAARHHFESRFSRPYRPLGVARRPKNLHESMNRVLLSAVPVEVGDGLGHRTCILNYELHMAFALGLTYTHRVSRYGSLSRDDALAVERLFGWGNGELTREYVLQKGCAEVDYVNDTCEIPATNVVCRRVRTRAKGGLFDQAVIIPDELAECFLQRGPEERILDQICFPVVQSFLAAYSEPNTLFQMRPKLCFRDYLFTNFSQTASWFSEKYWTGGFYSKAEGESLMRMRSNTVHRLPAAERQASVSMGLPAGENMSPVIRTRELSLDPKRVHVSLHIRRGDFFNYTNRVLIPDATYADIAGRVKIALDEMMDANVPVTVHVFSEGVPAAKERLKDNHDISSMEKVYVNEFGEHMPENHWSRMILRCPRFKAAYGVGRGWSRPDIDVKMHIATDTIQALHDMLASDFFVGSISGLSMQVVRNIGRGLTLLPLHESEMLEDEFLVPFDYARNNIPSFLNETLLYEKVAQYARKSRLACTVW